MRPAAAMDMASPYSASSGAPNSSWHSPVPYLFGGLAAMLGLVALSLLILVCSYWKVSGFLGIGTGDNADAGASGPDDDDAEAPGGGAATAAAGQTTKSPLALLEERIVVIMAGECKPTFLATPIASRAAPSSNQAYRSSHDEDGGASIDEKAHLERGVRTPE